MNTPSSTPTYAGYRFPAEIISHAVWIYFRFSPDTEMWKSFWLSVGLSRPMRRSASAVRSSASSMRTSCANIGQRPVTNGILMRCFFASTANCTYLWRAVDQDGNVLDILVQSRRNKRVALKFFPKLLKGCHYVPRVLLTDKLGSYGAAKREILPSVEHRQHRRPNNRAENSHQETRQRERIKRRFKSAGHAQRFLAAHDLIRDHFCVRWHRLGAKQYRATRQDRFALWNTVTGVQLTP